MQILRLHVHFGASKIKDSLAKQMMKLTCLLYLSPHVLQFLQFVLLQAIIQYCPKWTLWISRGPGSIQGVVQRKRTLI